MNHDSTRYKNQDKRYNYRIDITVQLLVYSAMQCTKDHVDNLDSSL